VLAAVAAERSPLPATHFHDGSSGAVDGNAHFYGLEISNLGTAKDVYPAAQYSAAVRWAAAICRHHGWSSRSVIGHREWSDWKNDPSFDMGKFRYDVAACLAAKPGAWGALKAPSAPPKTTVPPKETAMTPEDVWAVQFTSPADPEGPKRSAGTFLRYQDAHYADLKERLERIEAALAALATQAKG
jgi:hypothetical protein